MKHTPGPWAWYTIGGRLLLCADYGGRKVILCDSKGHLQTCDPDRNGSFLIRASGHEPDLRVLSSSAEMVDALKAIYAHTHFREDEASRYVAGTAKAALEKAGVSQDGNRGGEA